MTALPTRNRLNRGELGVVVLAPVLTFYDAPDSVGDPVDHIAHRTLGQFGLAAPGAKRWEGFPGRGKPLTGNSSGKSRRAV
jgi:4-hydroxy-3-polyprenylbenzoate decarboxylase